MPNWCTTNYVFYGDQGSIKDITQKLEYLDSLKTPLVLNGFGKLWCGCLVNLLGGDWNEVGCRGEIEQYELNDCSLHMVVTSAWTELVEWRMFIKSKYPKIDIVYLAEEPGCEIYETNDVGGLYFPEQYILDSTEDDIRYFNTLDEACDYVYSITKIKVDSVESIISALEKQQALENVQKSRQEDSINSLYAFHEITVNGEDT